MVSIWDHFYVVAIVHVLLCCSSELCCSRFFYQFSRSVVSDSLRPHGLQHNRPHCPSLTPGVHLNPCPLSRWCHPTFSSSCRPLLLLPSILPSIRVFSNESVLCITWPKYWSFSISPSNEYSWFISFRIDWTPFCPRDSQESSPIPQLKASVLQCSGFFMVNSHIIHDY